MAESFTLKSGVRVVVKRMEGLFSVTIGVLVGTGAAFETAEEDGISHFIEHMQFKGTKKRTAFEISDAFDALGAQVNAFTGKDMTCYYAKATSDHAAEAFALLAELFSESTFPEDEIVREKDVVVEEINMNEDTPDDLCLDLLSRAAFGEENYGRNILGTEKNVRRFSREELFAYKKKRYCPENIVLSFAGNISCEEAFSLAERHFGGLEKGSFEKREKHIAVRADNLFRQKPIEQVHFALCFPTVPRGDARYASLQTLSAVLGGNMSSRLFKRIREELGLAYSVYSYTTHYAETGLFSVYAGVNPKKADAAAKAVREVVEQFASEGCTEEEFARGKEQLKSSSIFGQESTASQMLLYGKQMLFEDEIYDFEARMREIDALTRADLMDAARFLDFSRAAVATVGNRKEGIVL